MKLLAGNSNRPLAEAIAAYLNAELTRATVHRFADMEVFVEIHENVRGEDVFIIQSTSFPANDNLMELLVCIDALRRAKHRRHPSLDQPYGGDPDGRVLGEKVAGHSPEGYGRTDAKQIRARVEAAIGELSDEQREVFVMREFQRMPFKEIADIVGVPEGTIKSRMRYALENLRLALADYAADLPGAADPIPARSRV